MTPDVKKFQQHVKLAVGAVIVILVCYHVFDLANKFISSYIQIHTNDALNKQAISRLRETLKECREYDAKRLREITMPENITTGV